MPRYYCYECARLNGLISPVDPSTFGDPDYQLEKFVKHTAPTGVYPLNSIFHDPTWTSYKNYMVTTSASGCLEVDDNNRKNLIYFAGEETGLKYINGVFTALCSGVKLVCSENVGRVHGFPIDFHPESKNCALCGRCVPFDPR